MREHDLAYKLRIALRLEHPNDSWNVIAVRLSLEGLRILLNVSILEGFFVYFAYILHALQQARGWLSKQYLSRAYLSLSTLQTISVLKDAWQKGYLVRFWCRKMKA